jgi:aminoglycoside phosphotransferase (APT) family kinase protein
MRAAAEAGIAPRVVYTNVEDKISITGFVHAQALPHSDALFRLPELLRELHALPPFERAPFNTTCTFLLGKGPAVDGFLGKFRSLKLMPEDALDEFFARWEEIAAVYETDPSDLVASHNDLFKPDNILFDGDRVWLVDWEAAFLNDRYADLAVVANQLVNTEEEERAFLHAYFGEAPDEHQLARFFVVRQLTHLFYTMALLYAGSASDWSDPAPEFGEFHRRIWAGETDITTKELKSLWGRVHWERFQQNVIRPRYAESLQTIADGRQAISALLS